MAVRKTMLILMCLFCGALARSDVDANNIYDLLSNVSDEQEISVEDLLSQSTIDDARVLQESLDDDLDEDLDNDLDDAINLELAKRELLGGCSNRGCNFCKTKNGIKFCFEARPMRSGFLLKFTLNNLVLFQLKISVNNSQRKCIRIPFVGSICVDIYRVDVKQRSACVRIQFKGHFLTINLKIACFKIGKREETSPLISTRL